MKPEELEIDAIYHYTNHFDLLLRYSGNPTRMFIEDYRFEVISKGGLNKWPFDFIILSKGDMQNNFIKLS